MRSLTILAPVVTTVGLIAIAILARDGCEKLIPYLSVIMRRPDHPALVAVMVWGIWWLARRGARLLSNTARPVWPSLVVPAVTTALGALIQLARATSHPYWLGFHSNLRISAEVVSEALPFGALFALVAGSACAAIVVQIGIRQAACAGAICPPPKRMIVGVAGSLAGLALVLHWGGIALSIAGVLAGFACICGLLLTSFGGEGTLAHDRAQVRTARVEILIMTVLGIGSTMVAMHLAVYQRLFEVLGGEAVDPALRAPLAIAGFGQLRVVQWVYPSLVIVSSLPVWVDVQGGSVRVARTVLRQIGGSLPWALPAVTGLIILYLEPYKHIAWFTFVRELPVSSEEACKNAIFCDGGFDYSCLLLGRASSGANVKCLARAALRQVDIDARVGRPRLMTIAEPPTIALSAPFDAVAPIRQFARLRLIRTDETGGAQSMPPSRLSLTRSAWHHASTSRHAVLVGSMEERRHQFSARVGCKEPIGLSFDEDVSASDIIALASSCAPGMFVFDPGPPSPRAK